MTVDRWDTHEHLDDDPRRTKPNGKPTGPWHDATTAIDGAAARALGDLARERWRDATGERLEPAPGGTTRGPRTSPDDRTRRRRDRTHTSRRLGDRQEVREIEAFTSTRSAEPSAQSILKPSISRPAGSPRRSRAGSREPDGPEIVIVLPETTEGWLEQKAMDGARQKLLHMLWRADRTSVSASSTR